MSASVCLRCDASSTSTHSVEERKASPAQAQLQLRWAVQQFVRSVRGSTQRSFPPSWPLQINQRIIPKRIHVRVEHVQPSRCREDFMKRRASNDAKKHEANMKGGECAVLLEGLVAFFASRG